MDDGPITVSISATCFVIAESVKAFTDNLKSDFEGGEKNAKM